MLVIEFGKAEIANIRFQNVWFWKDSLMCDYYSFVKWYEAKLTCVAFYTWNYFDKANRNTSYKEARGHVLIRICKIKLSVVSACQSKIVALVQDVEVPYKSIIHIDLGVELYMWVEKLRVMGKLPSLQRLNH